MKKTLLVVSVTVAALFAHVLARPLQQAATFPKLEGPYLGQTLPGEKPQLFAPGIVSTGGFERDVALTPDGREIYFGVAGPGYAYTTIAVSRLVGGRWTQPEVAPHMDDARFMNLEPAITPDGKRMFFLSTRPDPVSGKQAGDQDIWVMERNNDGWGEPRNLGAPVNTDGGEYFPSLTKDSTLYFTRQPKGSPDNFIYRARLVDGAYAEPERLPDRVNSGTARYNAFVDREERYLIVPTEGRKDSVGGCDYYLVPRNADDTWGQPMNLGPDVNTPGGGEYSPFVSPDGKYFFFMSSRRPPAEERPARLTFRFLRELYDHPQNGNADIYWMEAGFLDRLRGQIK